MELFLLILLCASVGAMLQAPPPALVWYEMDLDHFNFGGPFGKAKFGIRVLIDNSSFVAGGPILYYTGNEGDIEMFYENTGFMFDAAKELHALVVFGEHRYYGKSLPFGPNSFDPDKLGWLSTEQALSDHAVIAAWARDAFSPGQPVIAVGGSYGGMLAAWARMKYPNVFAGAIAASAPILQFEGLVDPEVWSKIATADFANSPSGPECASRIRAGYGAVQTLMSSSEGLAKLSKAFHTCSPIRSSQTDSLVAFLTDALTFLAVCDYPYETTFLQPLPPWPVNVACKAVMDASVTLRTDDDALRAMYGAINVFYNTSGKVPCFNITGGASPGLGDAAWDYQSCTEMVLPISSNGRDDMFLPAPWDLNAITMACEHEFGVSPRPLWAGLQWGGKDLKYASNIVFSNGELDPWRSGGVTETVNDSVIAIVIEKAAHHLDLRFAHPDDPKSVQKARELEMSQIHRWIAEFDD